MNSNPEKISGAIVFCHSVIDERHVPTGNCRHQVGGELQGVPYGLAICRYEGDECFYLFYCDSEWNTITDTYHETLQQAMDQAEFEFSGVSSTWVRRLI